MLDPNLELQSNGVDEHKRAAASNSKQNVIISNTNWWSLSYNGLARHSVIKVFAPFIFQTDRQNVIILLEIYLE